MKNCLNKKLDDAYKDKSDIDFLDHIRKIQAKGS